MHDSSSAPAIDLRHVAKTYRRRVEALRGIGMRVERGEIFGLLGPNGAGKSTLVKIMMTVVRPTRAEGTILGRPVGHRATLGRMGYLPEHHRFPPYLTGRQSLEYYAALAKVDRPTRKRRAGELLELVGMKDWAGARVGTFSKGMQQRIGLAQALMNDPELLVLDEPTDGLDPLGRREVREILRRLREQGKTVFLNSHLLSEVELVCDRVAILLAGRVARQGTLDELTAGSLHYVIEVAGPPPSSEELAAVGGAAEPGVAMEWQGPTLRLATGSAGAIQPVIDALRGHGRVIESVRLVRQSLEDFFLEAVREPGDGAPAVPGPGQGTRP